MEVSSDGGKVCRVASQSWIAVGDRVSPITRRSEVPWLDGTAYLNVKDRVPEPLALVAVPPSFSSSPGVPETVTFSLY